MVLNSGASAPLVSLRVPLLFMLRPIVLTSLIFLSCVCMRVHVGVCLLAFVLLVFTPHSSLPKTSVIPWA